MTYPSASPYPEVPEYAPPAHSMFDLAVASAPWVFAGMMIVLIPVAPQAVWFLYTPAAVLLAGLLMWRDAPRYMAFTWWIVFLSPMVRRLVDAQLGYSATNPILLAPLLTMGVPLIIFIAQPSLLTTRRFMPFLLIAFALAAAFAIGIANAGPAAAAYGLLTWLAPVVFGAYLLLPGRGPGVAAAMASAFTWGTLLLGAYGIAQFLSPAPWDVYWMVNSAAHDVLSPEPHAVRLFGTLNSFGPYAAVLMTGLLVCLGSKGWLRGPAAISGMVALLLSLVRSAWAGLAIGALVYLLLSARRRGTLLVAIAGMVGVLIAMNVEPLQSVIADRLDTFGSLGSDGSYQARVGLYDHFMGEIAAHPLGVGLGTTGMGFVLTGDNNSPGIESGLQDVVFSLGWLGALLYVAGFARILARGWLRVGVNDLAPIARSIALATTAMAVTGNIFVSVSGAILWCFACLALISEDG